MSPKPLEAPVTMMILFMSVLLFPEVGSDHAAIDTQRLAIHPTGIGSDEKRDDIGHIPGLSQTLHGRQLCQMLNLFRGLVVQEEISRGRSGCDGIDRNVAAAQFLGK